jgi:hypothetical protein
VGFAAFRFRSDEVLGSAFEGKEAKRMLRGPLTGPLLVKLMTGKGAGQGRISGRMLTEKKVHRWVGWVFGPSESKEEWVSDVPELVLEDGVGEEVR